MLYSNVENLNKKKIYFYFLLAISVFTAIYFLSCKGVLYSNDSQSYIDAWYTSYSKGNIDINRTPVYPLIIGLAETIGGKAHMMFIVILMQNLLFCIASLYFYKIAFITTKSSIAAFFATLLLIILPPYSLFRNEILTESFAFSGLILITYNIIAVYEGRSLWNFLGLAFWLLFLVFLRPALVFLLPVLTVAFLLMILKRKELWRKACLGLFIVIVVSSCLFFYMAEFKKNYGVFTMTNVGLINDSYMMLQDGTLDPQKTSDRKMSFLISEIYKTYGQEPNKKYFMNGLWSSSFFDYARTIHNLSEWNKTIQESKTFSNQVEGFITRFYYNWIKDKWFIESDRPIIASYINMAFICGYLLVFLYGFCLLVYMIAYKSIPYKSFLLLMIGGSNIIVVLVGAQSEFGRLVYPSKFIYLIMMTQMALVIVRFIKLKCQKFVRGNHNYKGHE